MILHDSYCQYMLELGIEVKHIYIYFDEDDLCLNNETVQSFNYCVKVLRLD